ncbi:MAG: peptidase U32 family protein [Thermodesulfobacteriota bacterium]
MNKVEIAAPAGNLPSLKRAFKMGADVVYAGFRGATNARNYEGLNFSPEEMKEGIALAHRMGRKVYITINTFPQLDDSYASYHVADAAYDLGADAVIIANLGVLEYVSSRYPDLNIHLSVQASASNYEAVLFYKKHFAIKRVVLPRVLTVDEMKELKEKAGVEIEVFALGGLCINTEGRCCLSSFITGVSTNTEGVCSPSRFVRFEEAGEGRLRITLNNILLNEYDRGEITSYPTSCKGRYFVEGKKAYVFESPRSLNIIDILPQVIGAGVDALKIEGRQRTSSYVAIVTNVLREAVDSYYDDPGGYKTRDEWFVETNKMFEGTNPTLGCYLEK